MMNPKSYPCCLCNDKSFSSQSGLWRHKKNVHGSTVTRSTNISCNENSCSATFSRRDLLKVHLASVHNRIFREETVSFKTEAEFLMWKEMEELAHGTVFVKHRGAARKTGNRVTTYFYCNREGVFNSRSSGKRAPRESSKTVSCCTASMQVTKTDSMQEVNVVVCHDHYGHIVERRHLRLSVSDRLAIAKQLRDGVPISTVLDKIRNHVGQSPKRIHILTKKDIRNIQHSFGLQGVERHAEDATSVMMMFQEFNSLGEDNPILFSKFQGQHPSAGHGNLSVQDLCIVIQHPLQREMMKSFGGKIICMDATHGTNKYGFKLITILVIDDFGEGFPVAWCLSNKEDRAILVEFLKAVEGNVGSITPSWFMSDDAGQYYQAWVSVFGSGPKKLLCTWHVDRAWQKNILSIIKDKALQCAVYEALLGLREELDEENFKMGVQNAKEWFQLPHLEKFGRYFSSYFDRSEEWAYCYRKGGINTNMYVESFFRVLKHVYFEGKVNRRMDRCIHCLLLVVRNKGFDRLIKLETGQMTRRISLIQRKHRYSLTFSIDCVTAVEGMYRVASATSSREYFVFFNAEKCPEHCRLRCLSCDLCVHEAHCTCIDFLIRGEMCKHIHLVKRFLAEAEADSELPMMTENLSTVPATMPSARVIELLGESRPQQSAKDKMINLLQQLMDKVHSCPNDEIITGAIPYAVNCLGYFDVTDSTPQLPQCLPIPANKNVQRQRPFTATKRKKPNGRNTSNLSKRLRNLQRMAPDMHQHSSVTKRQREAFNKHRHSGAKKRCIAPNLNITVDNHPSYIADNSNMGPLPPISQDPGPIVEWTNAEKSLLSLVVDKDFLRFGREHEFSENAIKVRPDEVDDAIVDADLGLIFKYFSVDAWTAVQQLKNMKVKKWSCPLCTAISCARRMVSCSYCCDRYHCECVGVVNADNTAWVCLNCNSV